MILILHDFFKGFFCISLNKKYLDTIGSSFYRYSVHRDLARNFQRWIIEKIIVRMSNFGRTNIRFAFII